VESALQNQKTIAIDPINEPMLLCNPSGPPPFQIFLERLWLADSRERAPQSIADDIVDPLEDFAVLFLPVQVVFPAVGEPA
jgi:hypothetical protein